MVLRSAASSVVGLSFLGLSCSAAGLVDPTTQDAATVTGSPIPLPVIVSDIFTPSGYMGDGETSSTAITVDTTHCLLPRPTGAKGDCYRLTYVPGPQGWGGVFWQYPPGNWGDKPGKLIAPGATKVTFQAAGATGQETVSFLAGGIDASKKPYRDSFKSTMTSTLAKTLMPYSIDLTGKTYSAGVIGGIAFTVTAPVGSTTPIVFYLDTILWEQ